MLQPRLSGSFDTHTRRSTELHRLQTMHRLCSSTSITGKAINRRAQNPMQAAMPAAADCCSLQALSCARKALLEAKRFLLACDCTT